MDARVTSVLLVLAVLSLSAGATSAQPVATPPPPAYLVFEVPSLRVVSQSRPDVLTAPIAPGSVMKAFTLAAALESGTAGPDTRILCRRSIDLDGRPVTCVHPDFHRGLDPIEAVAQSCNVYFATLARRLPRQALDDVLVRAGLAPSDPGVPLPRVALGIEGVKATPRQWLEAFLRLTGTSGPALSLRPDTRRVLRLGLEGAVRDGTASALWNAGYSGMAKTGTAPMPGGGSMGLVVAVVHTELPTHAIVVVAPGVNGATAARLGAETLARQGVARRPPAASVTVVGQGFSPAGMRGRVTVVGQAGTRGSPDSRMLRVGRLGRNGAYDVSAAAVEDYVARAVAGEGGDTLPGGALDAIAITARTYAERNRGRHAADGFDLCDLTHCLALAPASGAAKQAAARTRGRVLLSGGVPAEVYLSASCGGHTEQPSAVWRGAADPSHLRAVPDPFCATNQPWVSEVTSVQIQRVLEAAGLRGSAVVSLRVGSTSRSGRAVTLAVEGMVPPAVDANVFRMTAGRLLSWATIKSTRFAIDRTASGYRFTGRGRGHGVGLCVEGASARALAGAGAETILAAYFPGTAVSPARLPSTMVRVRLPEAEREQAPAFRAMVERELTGLAGRLGLEPPPSIDVVVHPTVESFGRASGLPWWAAARTRGTRIDTVPLSGLKKRGVVESTVRHELVHVLVGDTLNGRQLWVREGLAVAMAGEVVPADRTSAPCPTDAELRGATSPEAWRAAYQAAGRCVARALSAGTPWRDVR